MDYMLFILDGKPRIKIVAHIGPLSEIIDVQRQLDKGTKTHHKRWGGDPREPRNYLIKRCSL